MAVVRCSQGHYYDDEKFSRCPHCGIFTNLKLNQEPSGRRENDEKTMAFSSDSQSLGDILQRTVALENISQEDGDDQKTVGLYSGSKGNDFVTGWLVCVKGPEKGRDYRLHHGFNRIGRGYQMEICIVDDIHISRDSHCSIVYDGRSNLFSLVPSGGNLVYKDGGLVSQPVRLETGDVIAMGESEFEFIAFCREGRVWEKE